MVATAQLNLFARDALEARSYLDRLFLVRDRLPDARLVQYLEVMRGNERDDFLVRVMWSLLLALETRSWPCAATTSAPIAASTAPTRVRRVLNPLPLRVHA